MEWLVDHTLQTNTKENGWVTSSWNLISTIISVHCFTARVRKHYTTDIHRSFVCVFFPTRFEGHMEFSNILPASLLHAAVPVSTYMQQKTHYSLAFLVSTICSHTLTACFSTLSFFSVFSTDPDKPKRCPGIGLFYAFLATALFSVISLLVKTIEGVHAIEISAIRCFFQMLFTMPLLIYHK